MKEKRDNTLGDCHLTSANVVFLLCVLFFHSSTHLLVGLQYPCPILMQWDFTARLLTWAVWYLAAGLFEDVTGVEAPAQRQSVKLGKRHCIDQSSILIGMLAVCHRL